MPTVSDTIQGQLCPFKGVSPVFLLSWQLWLPTSVPSLQCIHTLDQVLRGHLAVVCLLLVLSALLCVECPEFLFSWPVG